MELQPAIRMLKALADETRWRVTRELLGESLTVSEIVARLAVSQYNVSKHLRILREAGIVQAERHGKNVICQVTPAFRQRLAEGNNILDLGCCTFRFDRVPSS